MNSKNLRWLGVIVGCFLVGLASGIFIPSEPITGGLQQVRSQFAGQPKEDSEADASTATQSRGGTTHTHAGSTHSHSSPSAGGTTAEDEHGHDDETEDAAGITTGIFDVTLAAQRTMGLERGRPKIEKFVENVSVPAIVRERPAISNLQASSKLTGIVQKIYVDVGQSVREGDRLVELELTGEVLAESQAALLDATKKLEIVQSEIARITPIAASGGVARKSLLEKQYEEKRLQVVINAKRQELLVKGLTADQLQSIAENGNLIRTITIRVPEGLRPSAEPMQDPVRGVSTAGTSWNSLHQPAPSGGSDPWVYSIEKLHVSPGKLATAGQPLCDLAFHETLLLEGQAYEQDVPTITRLLQNGQGVRVVLGSDEAPEFVDDVPILYMDNHIDASTQTIRFYLELENSVTSETRNELGSLFRSWKYRPEQRGHILLPSREWTDKMVLPAASVVQDGVDHIVFKHLGEHRPKDEVAHSEFQKVNVSILYQDRRHVVIEPTNMLQPTDEIALNNAYMLMLQLNKASGGGAGHTHDHDH